MILPLPTYDCPNNTIRGVSTTKGRVHITMSSLLTLLHPRSKRTNIFKRNRVLTNLNSLGIEHIKSDNGKEEFVLPKGTELAARGIFIRMEEVGTKRASYRRGALPTESSEEESEAKIVK